MREPLPELGDETPAELLRDTEGQLALDQVLERVPAELRAMQARAFRRPGFAMLCTTTAFSSMTQATLPAAHQQSNTSAHTPMMAQYLRVTFQAAWRLGITTQVVPSVPLESPCCLTALDGK